MISSINGEKIAKETFLVEYESDKAYEAILYPGKYKIECWGAQGAVSKLTDKGRGAYVSGEIKITRKRKIFLYVGEKGKINGGIMFNGGGDGRKRNVNEFWEQMTLVKSGSGGGASDVRLEGGNWNDTESLKSRIIVAAGGGGFVDYASNDYNDEVAGSCGGELEASSGDYSECNGCASNNPGQITLATGGTQDRGGEALSSKGNLGCGGNSEEALGGGGGSGYFGGAGGSHAIHRYGSGAGGSSFISGHEGCYAFKIKNSEKPSSDTNIHYSGLFFTDTIMIAGNKTMPSPNGGNETGHPGDGAIKVSVLYPLYITVVCKTNKFSFVFVLIIIIQTFNK